MPLTPTMPPFGSSILDRGIPRASLVSLILLATIAALAALPSRVTTPLGLNILGLNVPFEFYFIVFASLLAFITRPTKASFAAFSLLCVALIYSLHYTFYSGSSPKHVIVGFIILSPFFCGLVIASCLHENNIRPVIVLALLTIASIMAMSLSFYIAGLYGITPPGWDDSLGRLRSGFGGALRTGVATSLSALVLIAVLAVKQKYVLGQILLILSLIILFLAGSRGVLFSFLVALLLLLFLQNPGSLRNKISFLLFSAGTLIVLLLFVVSSALAPDEAARALSGFGEGGGDVGRLESGLAALHLWLERPLTGFGGGHIYNTLIFDQQAPYINAYLDAGGHFLTDPHNVYSYLLSEFGIGGALLIFMAVVYFAVRARRLSVLNFYVSVTLTLFFWLSSAFQSHLLVSPEVAFLYGVFLAALGTVRIEDRAPRRFHMKRRGAENKQEPYTRSVRTVL